MAKLSVAIHVKYVVTITSIKAGSHMLPSYLDIVALCKW